MNSTDLLRAETGRELREDGTFINTADIIVNALDPLGGVAVSDEQQHAIHEGTAFSFSTHGTIGAVSSLVLLGRIGAKQVHFDGMNVSMQAGGVLVELLEAPTVTSIGTLQSARRKNRAMGTINSNTMVIYLGATITGGDLIFDSLPPIVAGQGNNIQSAQSGIVEGWVLKQNTDYAIRLSNTTAQPATFDANFGWHESSIILS